MGNYIVTIVPTTAEHILHIRDNLREDDRREVEGLGLTARQALWRSFKRSVYTRTAIIDGEPVAAWGVAGSLLGLTGQPWLLTTEGVKKVSPLKFARIYQLELKEMLKIYPKMSNFVLSDYCEAVRLLEIVGFKLGESLPLGKHGVLFKKFVYGED